MVERTDPHRVDDPKLVLPRRNVIEDEAALTVGTGLGLEKTVLQGDEAMPQGGAIRGADHTRQGRATTQELFAQVALSAKARRCDSVDPPPGDILTDLHAEGSPSESFLG